jgi:aspartyl protease family protein
MWSTTLMTSGPLLIASLDGDDMMRAIYLVALLAFLASGLVFSRANLRKQLGALAAWAAIISVLVLAFAFRGEAGFVWQRLASALMPGRVTDTGSELIVERARDGMFPVDASVNGVAIRFLFDTGASSILLSDEDAKRLGYSFAPDEYGIAVGTANGKTTAARVVLEDVAIGNLKRTRIEALVAQPGATDISLLGHSFLDSVKSYEVSGDRLIIRY